MDLNDVNCFITVMLSLLLLIVKEADSIGCYKCSSTNRNNPDCEDTFNATTEYYHPDCMAGRKSRSGVFPAYSCIKLTAVDENSGDAIVVRDCVVDNGGTTSDNEIGRSSHCGWVHKIVFQGNVMKGCLVVCYGDGCNSASDKHISVLFLIGACMATILLSMRRTIST